HVVAGEQRVLELRQHGVVEPDDAVHQRLAGGDAGQRVRPDLILDGPRLPATGSQLAEGAGTGHRKLRGRVQGSAARALRTSSPRSASRRTSADRFRSHASTATAARIASDTSAAARKRVCPNVTIVATATVATGASTGTSETRLRRSTINAYTDMITDT